MSKKFMSKRGWEVPSFKSYQFFSKRSKYCVCIPVLNEGKRFISQLKMMRKIAEIADILILDGGSSDGSTKVDFLKANKVRTLLVKTGPGRLGAQLRMGYAYALKQDYAGIITIDGNGKDNPAAIPLIIKQLDAGYDYLQGSRFILGGIGINTPLSRLLAIRLFHAPLLSLGAGYWFTDTTPGYRGYSRRYLLDSSVQPFRKIFNSYELLAYLTIRAPQLGYKTKEVPITRSYPAIGKTPTHISAVKGSSELIYILLQVLLGKFNP